MPSWNATFAATDDWAADVHMFIDAIVERFQVLNGGNPLSFGLPTSISPGDDVQDHLLWAGMQSWCKTECGNFLNPTITWGANRPLADFTTLTQADMFSLASISAGNFTRQKPREIANASVSSDTDGNGSGFGQIAWNRTDHNKYGYNGSTWVITTNNNPVDMLDSRNSSPNTCTPGNIVAGDYIGPQLRKELRDCLNQLTVVKYTGVTRDPAQAPDAGFSHVTGQQGQGTRYDPQFSFSYRSTISWNDAWSKLTSDWGQVTANSGIFSIFSLDSGGGGSFWDPSAVNAIWAPGGFGIMGGATNVTGPAIKGDIYYYVVFGVANAGTSQTFDTQGITDASGGTPVNNGAFLGTNPTLTYMGKNAAYDLSGAPSSGSGGTVYLPLYGNYGSSSPPNQAPDVGSTSNAAWQGYTCTFPGTGSGTGACPVAIDYKVTGGFVYRP